MLGNHGLLALHALALQVEASPNGLDPAIHSDREVALARRSGAVYPARDLTRHDPAGPPHARERARERDRRARALGAARGGDSAPDEVAVRPEAGVEAGPVTRAQVAQPTSHKGAAARLPARRRDAHDRAEVPIGEAHLVAGAYGA